MNFNLLIPPTASPRPQSRGASRAYGGGAISRQSINPGAGGFGPPGAENMNSMFRDRFANINTAKAQIEKQREMDAAIERLNKEFENVDINRDGTVTIDEMTQYLQSRVRDNTFYIDNDAVEKGTLRSISSRGDIQYD